MKLMLRGTRAQLDAAHQYLAMVDVAPRQVAVELRVMELTRDDALKVGLDWSVLTGGTLQTIRVNNGLGTPDTPGGISADLGFRGGGTASILGLLDQIATRNNVLARPSILANDGVPTNIFVGDEVRYVKSITNSNNGGLQVVTDEVDVGVDFNVIARIGSDGNILLDLAPTLKVLQGFTDVPGGGQLPQTSRRSAQSQMTIKSGETIAIGGLIQDQDRKVHGGIPILKDLPLIGHLFGRTSNSKLRSEVVFFVTVKEVTEADRQGAANPRQAEKDNTQWPGNKDGKKGG
jgi:general secretion pathway protein D